jgi:conjugal transfer pilus assembly protein TraK
MPKSTRLRRLALGLLAAPISLGAAHAAQVIEAHDGVSVIAKISAKESTRIKVEGAAITDVVGNILSSNCVPTTAPTSAQPQPQLNPTGEVFLECDREKGQIYVRPVPQHGTKPINLFLSTAQATYTLVMQPVDMPAETIVIRDRALRSAPSSDRPSARAPTHVRGLKAMLVAMATEQPTNDMRMEELSKPIGLWAEARFMLQRAFEARGMLGEKYLLTNVSGAPMVIAEQEFYKEDVLGVSIENHNLQPGESTHVYVIRSEGQHR